MFSSLSAGTDVVKKGNRGKGKGIKVGVKERGKKRRYITGMSHVLGWRSAVSVHNAQRAKEQSEFFF